MIEIVLKQSTPRHRSGKLIGFVQDIDDVEKKINDWLSANHPERVIRFKMCRNGNTLYDIGSFSEYIMASLSTYY